jgi:RNA polymerase sigma factor (sigma-70 family)
MERGSAAPPGMEPPSFNILRIILNSSKVALREGVRWGCGGLSVRDIGRLFLAHQREILTYLTTRLQDRETAADLVQDTFLRYAEQAHGAQAGEVASVTYERAYLYRTAHNLAVDHLRRAARRRTESMPHGALADRADDRPSPEEVFAARERLERLRRAITELPRRTQQVFMLNRLEGFTYPEVARRLGLSESSVQKHLALALQHLMRRLEP